MLGSNQRPPPCRDGALPAELIAREDLNVPGCRGRGRLAAEMRWRVAALIALVGIAAIPASSDAAQPSATAATLSVSVKPARRDPPGPISWSASGRRETTGAVGSSHVSTGSPPAAGPRQVPVEHRRGSGAAARRRARPCASRSRRAARAGWCAGTFRGQVWDVIERARARSARPARRSCRCPRMVGKFTFRVSARLIPPLAVDMAVPAARHNVAARVASSRGDLASEAPWSSSFPTATS